MSRGICEIGSDGTLVSVTELTKIERVGAGARHLEEDGGEIALGGEEVVSMNMWGFTPVVFGQLERLFSAFLAERGSEMKSEFYIPFAVDELVRAGEAQVSVLRTESSWFGVTYREDRDLVVEAIAGLISSGDYPSDLLQTEA